MSNHRYQTPSQVSGEPFDFSMLPNPRFAGHFGRSGTAPLPETREELPFEDNEDGEHAPTSFPSEDRPRPLFDSHTFPRTGHNPFEDTSHIRQQSQTNFNVLADTIAGTGRRDGRQEQNFTQEVFSPYPQPEDEWSDVVSEAKSERTRSSTNSVRREADRQPMADNQLRHFLTPQDDRNRNGSEESARFARIQSDSFQRRQASFMTETNSNLGHENFNDSYRHRLTGRDSVDENDPSNWKQAISRNSRHLGRTPQEWEEYAGAAPVFGGEPGEPIHYYSDEHKEAQDLQEFIEPSRTVDAALLDHMAEHNSFRSDDSDSPPRHYEGCMLCSPLPTPDVSEADSEEIRADIRYASGDSPGPAPTEPPIPSERSIIIGGHYIRPRRSTEPQLVEGEVGRQSEVPMNGLDVARHGGLYHEDSYSALPTRTRPQAGPLSENPFIARQGRSLSTLPERDEHSSRAISRMPSRTAGEIIPLQDMRSMSTFASAAEGSRPDTGRTEDNIHLLSRSSHSVSQVVPSRSRKMSVVKEGKKAVSAVGNTLRGMASTPSGSRPRRGTEVDTEGRPPVLHFRDDDAHPGFRRDIPGQDGTTEYVDLEAPMDPRTNTIPDDAPVLQRPEPAHHNSGIRRFFPYRNRANTRVYDPQGHLQDRSPQHHADNMASRFFRRWFGIHLTKGQLSKYFVAAFIFILLLLVILLPIELIAVPNAVQKGINEADIKINSLNIIPVSAMTGNLKLNLTLAKNGVEEKSAKLVRVKKMMNLNGAYQDFNFMGLSDASNKAFNSNLLPKRSEFTLDNAPWSDLATGILFTNTGYEMRVNGEATYRKFSRTFKLGIDRNITLPGTGNVQTKLLAFNLNGLATGKFELRLNAWVDSVVQVQLGTIWFQMLYGTRDDGYFDAGLCHIDGFELRKFESENGYTALCQLKLPELMINTVLLGEVLSALYTPPKTIYDPKLGLYGINATTEAGDRIVWLDKAITNAVVPVPAAVPKVLGDLTPLEMVFMMDVEKPGYVPTIVAKNGFVSFAGIELPEQFTNFATAGDPVSYRILISSGAERLFTLSIPQHVVYRNKDGYNSTFSTGNITIEGVTFASSFLGPLLNKGLVNFTATVSANIKAETILGNTTLANIPRSYSWTSEGIDFGTAPFALKSLAIDPNTSKERFIISAELEVNSTSPIGLNMGYTSFALRAPPSSPIGSTAIVNLGAMPGISLMKMIINIRNDQYEVEPLSRLLFGQESTYNLESPLSSLPDLGAVLQTKNFRIDAGPEPPSVNGTYSLISELSLTFLSTPTPKFAITIRNDFSIPTRLYDLELTIKDAVTNEVLATIEVGDFPGKEFESEYESTVFAGIVGERGNLEVLKLKQQNGAQVRVEGEVEVGWAEGQWRFRVPVGKVMGLTA